MAVIDLNETPPRDPEVEPASDVEDVPVGEVLPGLVDDASDDVEVESDDIRLDTSYRFGVDDVGLALQTTSRGSSNLFRQSPKRRDMGALVESSRIQRKSLGKDPLGVPEPKDDGRRKLKGARGNPMIDGRRVTLAKKPRESHEQIIARLWHKTERLQLSAEARLAFDKAATGYFLPKGNKFSLPSVKGSGDQVLAVIDNLHTQLKMLRFHLGQCDIIDVMSIVLPVDVNQTSLLDEEYFDLLQDYQRLHPEIVANSCAWYNMWTADSYIRENMALTFMLLQNNTEGDLWSKCMELYEDYSPVQQGGPLMLCLISRRIQDHSEQALEYLKRQVAQLKLSKLEGEDVEQAIRLLESTLRALKNASTEDRSCVPLDFVKTIYRVLQTSSVAEFNAVFRDQLRVIQTKADMDGVSPIWPDASRVLALANNTCQRLKHSGQWDGVLKRSQAHTAVPSGPRVSRHVDYSKPPPPGYICFNCGGHHWLLRCKKPLVQARIETNKQKFFAAKHNSTSDSSRSGGKPQYRVGEDGKPLVLNKNGACVLDQKKAKKWRALQLSVAADVTSAPTSSVVSANVASHVSAIRSAVQPST